MTDQPDRPLLRPHSAHLNVQVVADQLPPVAAAGVLLIKIVLGMVMASIALLAIYLVVADLTEGASLNQATQALLKQASATPAASTEQLRQLSELARQLGEQRAAFRAFWLQTAQMVLLNLLLPLLTALLGYIFGTHQLARQQSEGE